MEKLEVSVHHVNEYLKEKHKAYLNMAAAARKAIEETGEAPHMTLKSKGRICGRTGIREVTDQAGWKFLSDTGAGWAGQNAGPSAPSSFMCALNSCIMHTAAVIAAEQEVDMDFCECEMEAEYYGVGGYLGFEDVPKGPQNIRFVLTIDSTETPERLEKFLADIERRCPVGSLLRVGPKGTLVNIHKD